MSLLERANGPAAVDATIGRISASVGRLTSVVRAYRMDTNRRLARIEAALNAANLLPLEPEPEPEPEEQGG